MAKVGIVTFHSAHNFGAVLQCLALKTVLSNLGHEVSVIDHRNPEIERCYAIKQTATEDFDAIQKCKLWLSSHLTYYRRVSRFKKYEDFINKYILSGVSTQNIDDYDCIVWGSDQIWRWDIIKDDLFYWGDCGSIKPRKITYAASAGRLDEHFNRNMNCLRKFDVLSVREPDLKDYLLANGIKSEVSLDPTLLLSKRDWESILSIQKSETKPYIFVYSMRNRSKVLNLARKIADKEGLEIKEIFSSFISPRFIFKEYSDGGPIDFITLIHNAKYVVTDSFHGTAFAVIFNRQFLTVRLNDGHDNRSMALLSSLELSDRMKENIEGYSDAIDYHRANAVLSGIIAMSISYLKNNIIDG